ncbi:MAG: hypothetical protein RXP27_02225 [Nitrososphaeria archaeon]
MDVIDGLGQVPRHDRYGLGVALLDQYCVERNAPAGGLALYVEALDAQAPYGDADAAGGLAAALALQPQLGIDGYYGRYPAINQAGAADRIVEVAQVVGGPLGLDEEDPAALQLPERGRGVRGYVELLQAAHQQPDAHRAYAIAYGGPAVQGVHEAEEGSALLEEERHDRVELLQEAQAGVLVCQPEEVIHYLV